MKKGKDAEQYAAYYLQKQQLTLLQQNYHCRFGEIDLIMRDDESLVFVVHPASGYLAVKKNVERK